MVSLAPGFETLALRLVLGAIFIVHGYPKLSNLKQTAGFLGSQGFAPAIFWAFVLSVTEFFGGIALVIGFASRIAAVLLIISMLVALCLHLFKWKTPFTKGKEGIGWEYDLLIIAGLLAVLLLGSGNISVDSVIGWMWG